MSACLHALTKDNNNDDADDDEDDEDEADEDVADAAGAGCQTLLVTWFLCHALAEYLYAFPIWLLSLRINNVIASLCGRHKTLATNNPNIQIHVSTYLSELSYLRLCTGL